MSATDTNWLEHCRIDHEGGRGFNLPPLRIAASALLHRINALYISSLEKNNGLVQKQYILTNPAMKSVKISGGDIKSLGHTAIEFHTFNYFTTATLYLDKEQVAQHDQYQLSLMFSKQIQRRKHFVKINVNHHSIEKFFNMFATAWEQIPIYENKPTKEKTLCK